MGGEGQAGQSSGSSGTMTSTSTGTSGSGGQTVTTPDDASSDAFVAPGKDSGSATDAQALSPRSTGCGKANPPSGNLTINVMGQSGNYVLSLPTNYAAGTAYPLGFAFHGRGRTGPECQDTDCIGFQSVMQDQAVLVYMTSLGGDGWEAQPAERPINVAFFQAVLAKIEDSYCIDQNRIFVAGTSSGAHFTNILACRFGDKLLAAAPVAGSMLEKTNCVGQVAALVIHGIIDSHVPFTDGQAARDFYLMQNGCSNTSVPTVASAHASVVATPESHQCVTYQGCKPGLPVMWCEHSEGGYDGSTHGWPKFAGQQIWDFVKPL
jgi:poly(3-hydroxybutyrate) depolymerase